MCRAVLSFSSKSLDFFVKSIKTSVKKLTTTNNSNKLSYQKAFDKIMVEKRTPDFQQVNTNKRKILANSFSDCKKIYPFDYEINDKKSVKCRS